MKKLINLLLVAALVIMMLAGSVSAMAEEGVTTTSIGTYTVDNPYHLVFLFYEMNDSKPDARAAVLQAINDYMIQNYQIEVEFLPMSIADYYANVPLMLSSGEELDVLPVMFRTAGSWIDMGGLLDLTPYMDSEEGQKIIDALGDEKIAYAASRNGVLFGFPANGTFYLNTGVLMRGDICDELGFTEKYNLDRPNSDIYDGTGISWDEEEELFATVKEAYPDMTDFYLATNCRFDLYFDILDDGFGVLDTLSDPEGTTIVNMYETEQYRNHVKRMADWFDKGYINKDAATESTSASIKMKAGNLFASPAGIGPGYVLQQTMLIGTKVYVLHVAPEDRRVITTSNVSFSNTGIAAQSKDPEMAFKFVAALYSDPTLFNLWQFGIEGVNYQLLDNGTADFVDGEDSSNYTYYQNSGWQMGNQFIGLVWNDGFSTADAWEATKEHNKNGVYSPAFGFAWDSTDYQTEVTALNAVKEQYVYQLETGSCGSENVDALLDEFNQRLYMAGLQDVMDAKQAQIDEWLASK